jgi:hypothetical protein
MKYMGSGETWEALFAIGKERSEPKKFETNGTGSDRYRLGHSYILEGSVQVWLNNTPLSEGNDYTVNYFDGEIQFKKYPQREDYIKVIYEFTNPIEDFLPVLSRKNFLGVQYIWKSQIKAEERKEFDLETQILWSKSVSLPTVLNPSLNVSVSTSDIDKTIATVNALTHANSLDNPSKNITVMESGSKSELSPLVFLLSYPSLI